MTHLRYMDFLIRHVRNLLQNHMKIRQNMVPFIGGYHTIFSTSYGSVLTILCYISIGVIPITVYATRGSHNPNNHNQQEYEAAEALACHLKEPIHTRNQPYATPRCAIQELFSHVHTDKHKPYGRLLHDIDIYTLNALCSPSNQDVIFKRLVSYRKIHLLRELHKRGLSIDRRCANGSTLLDKLFIRCQCTAPPSKELAQTGIDNKTPITHHVPVRKRTINNIAQFCNKNPQYARQLRISRHLYTQLPRETQNLIPEPSSIDYNTAEENPPEHLHLRSSTQMKEAKHTQLYNETG